MRGLRIVFFLLAIVAGVGAVALVRGELERARQASADINTVAPTPAPPPVEAQKTDVLVATRPLRAGERLRSSDMRWQPWPSEAVVDTFVTRDDLPSARNAFSGVLIRASMVAGEPIANAKLIHTDETGYMAAVIRDGMRAFAIEIELETGVGGFVVPGDYVDVVLTTEQEIELPRPNGEIVTRDIYYAETLITSARVLAVDTVVDAEGEATTNMDRTVTLEVMPDQVEILSLADEAGRVTLALRGVSERLDEDGRLADDPFPQTVVPPGRFDPRSWDRAWNGIDERAGEVAQSGQTPLETTAGDAFDVPVAALQRAAEEAQATQGGPRTITYVRWTSRSEAPLE